MLTYHISLYCLKAYHGLDHLICIILPKSNIFNETQTQSSFQVCGHSLFNILTKTNHFVLCTILLSCLVSKIHKNLHWAWNPGQIFRGMVLFLYSPCQNKQLCLGVLLSFLVSELQKMLLCLMCFYRHLRLSEIHFQQNHSL